MESKNKQAGMPSDEKALQFVKDWLWDSAKFGGDRKSESFDREQTWDAAQMIKAFVKQNCPPPKSEAEVEEIKENVESVLSEYVRNVNDSDSITEQLEEIIEQLSGLSAPSKGKYSEEDRKEAFQAGKYLGFGEAHRRPGNYHSYEEWVKLEAPESSNTTKK